IVAARGAEKPSPERANRLRSRPDTGGGSFACEALGHGHRLRDPPGGRELRPAGSRAAVGPGRPDRGRRHREPEHDRRARDRQPGLDAVARQGQGDRPGMVPRPGGGQAIAEVLTGKVNPSGRLPVTFPAGLDQTPRPELPGMGTPWGTPTTIEYNEGAEVGYRWFAKTGARPMYAFGHGLSYTTFSYSDLAV